MFRLGRMLDRLFSAVLWLLMLVYFYRRSKR